MRKFSAFLFSTILLMACNNFNKPNATTVISKTRLDSSYATYSLGQSLEAFTTKVYIVYKDTFLMKQVDSFTSKRTDTTLKTYFIPRLDTLFVDQGKRLNPQFDSVTKKVKTTILWVPIDEAYVLKDYKK